MLAIDVKCVPTIAVACMVLIAVTCTLAIDVTRMMLAAATCSCSGTLSLSTGRKEDDSPKLGGSEKRAGKQRLNIWKMETMHPESIVTDVGMIIPMLSYSLVL